MFEELAKTKMIEVLIVMLKAHTGNKSRIKARNSFYINNTKPKHERNI